MEITIDSLQPGARFRIGTNHYILCFGSSDEESCDSGEPTSIIPDDWGNCVAVNLGTARPVSFMDDHLVIPE